MKSVKTYLSLVSLTILFLLINGCSQSDEAEKKEIAKQTPSSSSITKKGASESVSKPFNLEEQREAFSLTKFDVLDISESEYDKTPAIAISFSVPIEATVNVNQFIQITTKKGIKPEGAWVLNESQTRLYFPHVESQTNYKIEVSRNIPAITGKTLGRKVQKSLRTARLEDSVKFLSKGKILPAELTSGLAVESVNIKEVDINFHRVNKESTSRVLRSQLEGYLYQLEELSGYTELVYTGRYVLEQSKNKRITSNIPVHQIAQLQEPGIYIAVMKPAGRYSYNQEVTSFYISDLALHTRQFENGIEVHALSISSGEAKANVNLEVLSGKGTLLASAKTDANGNHRLAGWDNDAVILATQGENFAVISLGTPALDLSEQLSITRKSKKQELFLYGPRDLYRPGETINVNGLLRGPDGEMIASVPLQVSLIRPDGRTVKDFTWRPTIEGFYEYELNVAKTEMTGEWRFLVNHPSKEKFEYVFSVEEFLPERMRLSLESNLESVDDPQKNLTISGQGDYLYGAPAAGNRISASMKLKPIFHPLKSLKDFYFGMAKGQVEEKNVDLDDKKLSDTGSVSWTLPNIWHSSAYPTQLVFEASLFESGGRPVTRRVKQIFWPGKAQYGVRKISSESYLRPYTEAEFEIIHADIKAKLLPLDQFEVSLIREDTRYYWRANRRDWGYSSNRNDRKVYARTIKSAKAREQISVPVEYGTYRFEIRDKTGQLKTSYRFFAGWSWDESGEGSISGARPDRIRLQFDKENYKPGENAKIKLISPHKGRALVRVESQKLLWEKQLTLDSTETEIAVPVEQNWNSHDLYVTAMVISPPEEIAKEIQLPKRAFGVAPLRLDRSERRLSLKIESPELVAPEQKIKVKIINANVAGNGANNSGSKESNGQNQKYYVTLAAVDTGVLSLSNYQIPKPHEWFYGQRGYKANIRDSFSQLIKNHKGINGKLKFGGDAELARGGEQAANEVQIVSIFSKLTEFDSNGEAIVELDLPDFNGELQLMALAFSSDQFGHQQESMTVRAPLVAEISRPRFLALGDKAQVSLDIQNMSGMDQKLEVSFESTGAVLLEKQIWEAQLSDGAKQTKSFTVSADSLGTGDLTVSLVDSSGEVLLSRQWKLSVRSAYPAEFKRQRKVIQKDESFVLSDAWLEGMIEDTVRGRIEYARVPPLNSDEHMDHLFQYPYGCLEQTSSRAWPLVSVDQSSSILNRIESLNPHSQKVLKERNKHIDAAIQRVSGMQRYDGSFGLWSNQSDEKHWLTSYALEFLDTANQKGYGVPSSVLTAGYDRLEEYVKSMNPTYSERRYYSQEPEHYALAYRAYAAYLLAKKGRITLSDVRQVSKRYVDKSHSGLPYAHLAAAFEALGDLNSAKGFWNKAIAYRDYKNRYLGDYGSRVRDITWVMTLATESKLKVDYLDLIYQINDALLEKRWFSTQERFALYRLSNKLETMQSEKWSIEVGTSAKDKEVIESSKSLIKSIRASAFKNGQSATLLEGESLFVDLQMVGYPSTAPKEVSEGLHVRRTYYNMNGTARNLNNVKSGDYVLVRVDAISDQRMPEALLVDFLPAGFELENPGLEYAYDYSDVKIEGYTVSRWMSGADIKHKEFRDDRFVMALELEKKRWSTVFYLMRAVTPGEYRIPPTQAEDMYRPNLRAVGKTIAPVTVAPR